MGLYFEACHRYFAAEINKVGEIVFGNRVIGKKDDLKLKRMLVESIEIQNVTRAYVSRTQFKIPILIDSSLFRSQSLRIVHTNNERHGILSTGRWHSTHGHIELRIGNSELQNTACFSACRADSFRGLFSGDKITQHPSGAGVLQYQPTYPEYGHRISVLLHWGADH